MHARKKLPASPDMKYTNKEAIKVLKYRKTAFQSTGQVAPLSPVLMVLLLRGGPQVYQA
jgi:hypothetical protein